MHLFSKGAMICVCPGHRGKWQFFLDPVLFYLNGILMSIGGKFQGQLSSFEACILLCGGLSSLGTIWEAIQSRDGSGVPTLF